MRKATAMRRLLWALLLAPTLGGLAVAADDYKYGPDSSPQDGVPKGVVKQFQWNESKVFPGTERDCWVYVPAQYKADGPPACVMVFQDGGNYVKADGQFRVPVVFDNLIHKKEMPVTVGIFLNPGTFPNADPKKPGRSNRSFEYDTPSPQYAKFLDEEILPHVGKTLNLRADAAGRAICGISSGGICAFVAAWERPDLFSKVLSHVGSFTNIQGGDVLAGRIRKTEKKPLRIFLQDGAGDLDNLHGSWPLANQSMAASLRIMGYDYRFAYGDGPHGGKHGGVLMPESLSWLWRDTPSASR